ncbi:Uncharacterized conserved protein (some members contain a von Willebrand factor type A (vWA) domain) [Chlamydia abortus]|uniref:DUF58 domain-containing protein n=1 Tax=Paenibacillus residui TaxID=629724 RepID=A0ABW3D793_9BACL|nr:Uncharacterized conserved protein (some members contain a von Willebrand factor type A (vWA) domain) [Chlamydia abortus]
MGIHWILFVSFIVVLAQSFLYKRKALKHLSVGRSFNKAAVFEGEEVQLVERIANRKWLPVPWLKLESLIHANLQFQKQYNLNISGGQMFQNHSSLFSLMPYTQITRRHYIRCMKRGAYSLDTATLTCGDLLGMQSVFKTVPVSAQLLVYPKTVPMEEIPLPYRSWQGDLLVRRWIMEDPFMINGVREYRYGDSMKDVNWKATARVGTLQVHNRGFTADHRLMICVNFEVSEEMWNAVTDPELIERGISYAATLAEDGIRQGMEVGFGCNGYTVDQPNEAVRIEPVSGQEHLTLLYETMAKLVIECSCEMSAFLEAEAWNGNQNTVYLLITPYVSAKMQDKIHRLESNGNRVEIIPLNRSEGGEQASA